MKFDFSDKWFLITGASSGIGKACVKFLDSCGANIVLASRSDDSLRRLSDTCQGSTITVSCDLKKPSNVDFLFQRISAEKIKLNGLVYAAGIAPDVPISQFDAAMAVDVFNVNFFSFCAALKYCSKKRYMAEDSAIVAVSAYAILRPNKAQATYIASKSALEGYIRVAAKELADKRIRVNAVQPAAVDTPMAQKAFEASPAALENIKAIQKYGIINPDILAQTIGFLLSDNACYMSGLAIPVDAGALYCSGL